MEKKKCPYCGRSILYSTIFSYKKKGVFVCSRCKKESKIKIDKRIFPAFFALVLLLIVFMIIWVGAGNGNNILGTIIVAVLLIGFYYLTPLFVTFIPIKKHYNDMVTQKQEENQYNAPQDTFVFNREAFDKIKKQKIAGALVNNNDDNNIISNTKIEEKYVPIIEDVKESYVSSFDGPLKKIEKNHQYIAQEEQYEEVKEYVPKKRKKPTGNKYSANRRF